VDPSFLNTKPAREEAYRKAEALLPKIDKSRLGIVLIVVFFASLFAPFGIALWRLAFGDISDVNWVRLWAGLVGFATLALLWRLMVHFNTAAFLLRPSVEEDGIGVQ
jgi:cytochrome b subunit of formate dehydrogenase